MLHRIYSAGTARLLAAVVPVVSTSVALAGIARPDHVVIVIEENHDQNQIINSANAPYINNVLKATGLYYSNAHGTDHDSQPNYLEIFSGSNPGPQGINSPLKPIYPSNIDPAKDPAAAAREDGSDAPVTNAPFTNQNLGASLIKKGFTFAGYSESQPTVGFTGTQFPAAPGFRQYVQKHNPWVEWQATSDSAIGPNQLPSSTNQPLTNLPTDFSKLPAVSFIVPNEANDLHDTVSINGKYPSSPTATTDADGNPVNDATTIQHGDAWLKDNIEAFRQWATTHNSLLITTFDENDFDFTRQNNIPLIVNGDPRLVQPGVNGVYANHFSVLRTLEDQYGLPYAGLSADVSTLPTDSAGRLSSVPLPASAWSGLAGLAGLIGLHLRRRLRTADDAQA